MLKQEITGEEQAKEANDMLPPQLLDDVGVVLENLNSKQTP